MTTTDAQRLHLLEAARETWDDEAADTLLAALPPAADDLATTDDLRVLGSELRREMADLRTDLRTEMADLRSELRTEMRDGFAALGDRVTAQGDRIAAQGDRIADVQRILLIAMVTMLMSAVGLAFAAARFA